MDRVSGYLIALRPRGPPFHSTFTVLPGFYSSAASWVIYRLKCHLPQISTLQNVNSKLCIYSAECSDTKFCCIHFCVYLDFLFLWFLLKLPCWPRKIDFSSCYLIYIYLTVDIWISLITLAQRTEPRTILGKNRQFPVYRIIAESHERL